MDPLTLYPERLAEKYVLSVTENGALPYRLFGRAECKKIADAVCGLYASAGEDDFVPKALACAFVVWSEIYGAEGTRAPGRARSGASLGALRRMLSFISENYGEKIYLDDIARSGSVCRSGCNALFRKYLHRSPVMYLVEYRLSRAKELLTDTDMRIIDVSLETGFPSVAYFISAFRKNFGITPSGYRRSVTG